MACQDNVVKRRRKVFDTDDEDARQVHVQAYPPTPIATSSSTEMTRQPYTEDKDDMPLAERGRRTIATPNRTPQDEKVKLRRIIYDTEDEEYISLSERRRRAARSSQSPMAYTCQVEEDNDMPIWKRRRKVVNYNEDSPLETSTSIKDDTLIVKLKVRGRKQKASVTSSKKPRTRADGFEGAHETCKGSLTKYWIRLTNLQTW